MFSISFTQTAVASLPSRVAEGRFACVHSGRWNAPLETKTNAVIGFLADDVSAASMSMRGLMLDAGTMHPIQMHRRQ